MIGRLRRTLARIGALLIRVLMSRAIVWSALILASYLIAGAYVWLVFHHPLAALLLATHGVCFMGGLALRDWRRAATKEVADWIAEEIEAVHGADLYEDVRISREHAVIDGGSGYG